MEEMEAGRCRWSTRANIFRRYQARVGPLDTSELIWRLDPLLQLSSVLYKPVLAGSAHLPTLGPPCAAAAVMDSVMLCPIHLAADIRSVSLNSDNLKVINIVGDAVCPSGVISVAGY